MQIAVVGCGTIGQSWAVLFAAAGHDVTIHDPAAPALRAAVPAIEQSLRQLQAHGRIESAQAAAGRIRTVTDLSGAVAGAGYVQESAPEDAAVKRALFAELDRLSPPDAILASSTSALLGSEFLGGLAGGARCLVAHPANPPHLLPLVELLPSPWTSQHTIDACASLLRSAGQHPVLLKREIPGFVMNRLQAAVINEAISLVMHGVMSPGDIDDVMRFSLGLRWALMGPFETMELNAPNGFRDYAEKFGESYRGLGRTMGATPVWDDHTLSEIEASRRGQLALSEIGKRQAWRDGELLALRTHLTSVRPA